MLLAPLFPLNPSYGSVVTPTFSTRISGSKTGWENRNANWQHPKSKFNAALTVQNQLQLEELNSFFNAMKAAAWGFRVLNVADYKSCSILSNPAFDDQIVVASATEGQTDVLLTKTYTEASGTRFTVRLITQPSEPSVLIGVDGVELVAGVGFNMVDGKAILTTPLTVGQVVTSGYEYYLPMRFVDDELPVSLDAYMNGSAQVPVIETRVKTS